MFMCTDESEMWGNSLGTAPAAAAAGERVKENSSSRRRRRMRGME
jgi:hypothetical protein